MATMVRFLLRTLDLLVPQQRPLTTSIIPRLKSCHPKRTMVMVISIHQLKSMLPQEGRATLLLVVDSMILLMKHLGARADNKLFSNMI